MLDDGGQVGGGQSVVTPGVQRAVVHEDGGHLVAADLLVGMFLFVFIGSALAPVDLTETGSEMLHTNMEPAATWTILLFFTASGIFITSRAGSPEVLK